MDDLSARVREAIQAVLDAEGDGWAVSQHVVVVALERITDGRIESGTWCWTPPGQPEWMTSGLLDDVIAARESNTTDY